MSCPNDDTLAAFAAGRLDARARFDLVDHAGSCESCHAAIDALEAPTLDPDTGDVEMVGRYELRGPLGAGGMGVVYAARDPELGRDIAIKLLRGRSDDSRLRREAQALARLAHPNVVAVHDVGVHHGQTFVAMALIDGQDLRAWLKTPRSIAARLRVLIDAGRGLAAAHAVGLIHRDLKPENILVTSAGHGLVGDFGLARDVAAPDVDPSTVAAPAQGSRTVTGTVLGTPAYMAPEQAKGTATAASDQYSFCVTAWEALYGARPSTTRPRGRIPAHVHRALVRGLAPAPADRHGSIDALLRALSPRTRRTWTWPLIALAGIAAAAIAIVRPGEPARCRSAPQRLAGIWDPPQRVISRLALGRVLDVDSAQRAVAALDRRAESWSTEWTTTCKATERSPFAFERKVACLDRQLAGLAAASRRLSTADATVARHVFDLTAGLGIRECDDSAAIAPPTAAQRNEVIRVDDALERASVANFVAKPSEAIGLATPALADARRLGYPPLVVRALLVTAAANGFGNSSKIAVAQLHEAINLALAAGDDYTVARALITLAGALAYTGQLDETERELELAVAALTRIDKLAAFALEIAQIRADVAAARGQFAASLGHLDEALAAFHARGEPDPLTEATLIGHHGAVLVFLDRAPAAIADYERALVLTREAVGPANPLTALAEFELASARIDADGITTAGLAAVTHAHTTLIAALGADNYDTAFVGLRLAKLELELDDLAAARPLCEQIVATFTATVGRDAGKTFDAELQLALVDMREGHLAEAATRVADVEARMIAARGKDYAGLADALRVEGELRIAQGQADAAFTAYERAGVLITAALGSEDSELVLISLGRGLAELARARPDRAIVELRTAERGIDGAARDTALLRLALAEALWLTGDHAGARTTAGKATAGLDAIAATADPVMRAKVAAWLAAH